MPIVHIVQFGFKPDTSPEKIDDVRLLSLQICTLSYNPPDLPPHAVAEGQLYPSDRTKAVHQVCDRRSGHKSRRTPGIFRWGAPRHTY